MSNTIDWNAPLQLRDGRPARLVGMLKSSRYTHIIAATNTDGQESLFSVDSAGYFTRADLSEGRDVINVPKKTVWLNIYLLSDGSYSICEHTSRAAAESAVDETTRRVACVETI